MFDISVEFINKLGRRKKNKKKSKHQEEFLLIVFFLAINFIKNSAALPSIQIHTHSIMVPAAAQIANKYPVATSTVGPSFSIHLKTTKTLFFSWFPSWPVVFNSKLFNKMAGSQASRDSSGVEAHTWFTRETAFRDNSTNK